MWKSISVASTFGVAFLSIGSALAADPMMDVPPGAPPVEGAPPRPIDPDHLPDRVTPPPPSTTTTATTESNPTTTTEVIPPSTPAGTPQTTQPAPDPSFYPDARNNQFVERGFGKTYPGSVLGAGVLLGGGVQDFSRGNIRDMTRTGGFWSARLVAGTREYVGLEAAYIGSAQSISSLGLDNDAVLMSNGAEGALRLNLPIVRGAGLFEPFAFGGAGWSRFHVARTAVNTSDVASNDDVLSIPYGAGMAFAYRGFMADARFTYRSTFYNDLLRTTGGSLDTWSAGAQLGFEF
ncbi:MAG TPA: hypothetical protein VFH68_16855 [Polyangia bacterium]|jgi:hypothetical protein|nr:hypothetical protein [Polyangia bacterium]